MFGLKLKVVTGYPGQNEAFLAMERGEIDGYAGRLYSALLVARRTGCRRRRSRHSSNTGPEKRGELAGVPYAPELVTNEDDRILLDAAFAPLALGRPFVMPPGVPAERLAAMRKALADTFADPGVPGRSKRLGLGARRAAERRRQQLKRLHAGAIRAAGKSRPTLPLPTSRQDVLDKMAVSACPPRAELG